MVILNFRDYPMVTVSHRVRPCPTRHRWRRGRVPMPRSSPLSSSTILCGRCFTTGDLLGDRSSPFRRGFLRRSRRGPRPASPSSVHVSVLCGSLRSGGDPRGRHRCPWTKLVAEAFVAADGSAIARDFELRFDRKLCLLRLERRKHSHVEGTGVLEDAGAEGEARKLRNHVVAGRTPPERKCTAHTCDVERLRSRGREEPGSIASGVQRTSRTVP